jgi:hypothetical protein
MKRVPVNILSALGFVFAFTLLSGCVTQAPYDYSAFERAKPSTILVMPPLNDSPDVNAVPSVWSHVTWPLAEAGYYVLPVTLVDETFRQNGVMTSSDANNIPVNKLQDYFGADAALYIKVKSFGTSYTVINSASTVRIEGKIVDLRSGESLWEGGAYASTNEEQQQNQGGLVGLLVTALVKQIAGTVRNESHRIAGIASSRLLSTEKYNGILAGPRSPDYGKPRTQQHRIF